MKNQPFVIPLAGLILGIMLADGVTKTQIATITLVIVSVLTLLFVLLLLSKKNYLFAGLFFFLFTGFYSFRYHNHWVALDENRIIQTRLLNVSVIEAYKPSKRFKKYKVSLQSIDSTYTTNTLALLYWSHSNPALYQGDEVWLNQKLRPTQKPLNPYQFDYGQFLTRRGIHYILYSDTVYNLITPSHSIRSRIEKHKEQLYKKLITNGYSESSADLISAMLLGNKNELDKSTIDQYRKTGVVHILSISGLHVMMIFSVMMVIFYPLTLFSKGKVIRIFFCLVVIWLFAYFVGFLPSVLRASLMISIYYISQLFHRKPNVYHTLAVSAFLLLLWNPNNLFEIGFQLSYSAVFFIVWLIPIFWNLLRPKTGVSRFAVGLFATSIAAQLGTFPIISYYFHQSSGLFLAGNLVMVLASYFMVVGGLLSVCLGEFNLFPSEWIWLFNNFIQICNDYIAWLSGFEFLVFDRISFRKLDVILLFFGLVLVRYAFHKRKYTYWVLLLFIFFIFETHRLYENYKSVKKEELVFFHQNANSVIGVRNGLNLDVYILKMKDSATIHRFILEPYEIQEGIKNLTFYEMSSSSHGHYFKSPGLLYWKHKKILLTTNGKTINPNDFDYILIQHNSMVKLDTLANVPLIILDGSNYPNHMENSTTPIWRTRENGALRISP